MVLTRTEASIESQEGGKIAKDDSIVTRLTKLHIITLENVVDKGTNV